MDTEIHGEESGPHELLPNPMSEHPKINFGLFVDEIDDKTNDNGSNLVVDMTIQKYAQLLFGPIDTDRADYIDGFIRYFEKIKRTLTIINLDPITNLKREYFRDDIRDDTRSNVDFKEIGNNSILYTLNVINEMFEQKEWRDSTFDGSDCPYFIINMPGSISLSMHYEEVSKILSTLVDYHFNVVCVNIISVLSIKLPNDVVASWFHLASQFTTSRLHKYPLVNVYSGYYSISDQQSEIMDMLESLGYNDICSKVNLGEWISPDLHAKICNLFEGANDVFRPRILHSRDDERMSQWIEFIDEILKCKYSTEYNEY